MEAFLEKYSAVELGVLATIPRMYRNKRAHRYMQDVTHINPNRVSKSNMRHLLEHRLPEGTIGLSAEEKSQKGDRLLTGEEDELYDAILKTRWTLKHITFDYDVIKENGNVLKSLKQRMRENRTLDNSHAIQETGKDDNVFFTVGSPRHKGAGFLHGQGGHVVTIDVAHFSDGDRFRGILSGLQLSDHWFQYLNEGCFSQTYGDTWREVRFSKEAAFTLKGHKTYSYHRRDGTVLKRTLSLGQEAVTGKEVLPFIAYNLILELRYIGGRYRRHLFDNLGRREIVELAIDSLYHSSNFEVTVPSQIDLDSPHIKVEPQDGNPATTVHNARLMHEAISDREIDAIKTLLTAGVSVDILDAKGVPPLIKALSTYKFDIAYLLIENGANLELKYRNYSALTMSILTGRLDIVEKILSKKIIIDARDCTMFRQVDINRDINAISAGMSRGYLGFFLRAGLNVEKFFPYIMFLLTKNIISEKVTMHSINLLLQSGFKFDYGKNKKSYYYFSLTFLNTIHQQKLTLVEHLIRWGCKLNATISYCDHRWFDVTPLMMAVISGNVEIVKILVKSGVDINKSDKHRRTALMLAEEMKYEDIIEFLKCQSHPELKNNVAPKEIAKALVYWKSRDEIYFLIGQKRNKKNYELFSLDNGKDAWEAKSLEDLSIKAVCKGALIDLLPHIAHGEIRQKIFDRCDLEDANVVIETHEYLVDKKLKPYPNDEYRDVKWVSADEITNRQYSISHSDYPLIESLIKNYPFTDHTYFHRLFKINAQLFAAVQQSSCSRVGELLAAGADANSLNHKNLSPLAVACDTPAPNLGLVEILIASGALPNYACCYEASVLDTPHPNLKRIQTLIQNGFQFNDTYFYEMGELVPLQLALLHRSPTLVSLLCEKGANPNQKLAKGTTPLLTACGLGDMTLIEELVRHGADFKTNENKGIFAGVCAVPCTDDVFDYLLDRADIEGLSFYVQCTPLMACVKLGDINRVKKLLAKGADPFTRHPRTMKSAFDFALETKNGHVIDILSESINGKSQTGIVKEVGGLTIEKADKVDCIKEREISKILAKKSLLHQADIFNTTDNFEGAFKDFYDSNIKRLSLVKEGVSDGISNTDNEAVHILLDKFSAIAQNGTEEDRNTVRSFFLNRMDHRDLSHLQASPLALPYHTPYVTFVMEQEYHGKRFRLFSLSETLRFYHSPDVSFCQEAPVSTWLKILRDELPSFGPGIDNLLATMTLLDNVCGDKRVTEAIFKQYIDTFDRLPVLSREAVTLVTMTLVFFNSFSSSSLKKNLLSKLNWNRLSDMECRHLSAEDFIFLYRIHDTALKFPSVKKQKLLGNLCLDKIKAVPFVNYKITLLKKLLFTNNRFFNSPLIDSVFRDEIMTLWIETILIQHGLDDGSYAYYHAMKKVIDCINNKVYARDQHHLFEQLRKSIQTQSCLSTYISTIITQTETKDSTQEKKDKVIVLGNLIKMISQTEIGKIRTLYFLSIPLTAESLDTTVKNSTAIHNWEGIQELVKKLSTRRYNKNDVKEIYMVTYHQFWDLNLEERASVMNYLLSSDADSVSKCKKETYYQVFLYVAHKLFPNAQSDDQEKNSKASLIGYLKTIDECKCEYLLAVMITASNEANSESNKAVDSGRKFAIIGKYLSQVHVKFAQAILSHLKTPENMLNKMHYINGRANLPYHWNLCRLMDKVLPPHEKKCIARLLGSYNFVRECRREKNEQVVLFLLRDAAKKDVSHVFTHLSKVAKVCEHYMLQPHKEATLNRIAEVEEMPTVEAVEMNKDCRDNQLSPAEVLYRGVNTPVNIEATSYQIEFTVNIALSRRKGHRCLDRTSYEFSDQPNISDQDKIVHKTIDEAMIKTSGYIFDCDQRNNKKFFKRLKNNNIGFGSLDYFGEIFNNKAGMIELQQLSVLRSLTHASSYPMIYYNECLNGAIKSVDHTDGPTTHLIRIPETCHVMQDLKNETIDTDLIELLKPTHTHPLPRAEIKYSMNETNSVQHQPTVHNRSLRLLNHSTNSMPCVPPHCANKVKPNNNGPKSQQKYTTKNKQIFVTTGLILTQGGTGDYYANILVDSLKEKYRTEIIFIPDFKDEISLYQQIGLGTPKEVQPILHVIVDVADTALMLTPERLQTFKDEGGCVVVTTIGFSQYNGSHDSNLYTISLLEKADYAIFLDGNDQRSAIEIAEIIRKKIPPSKVVAFPAKVFPNKASAERGGDIISFGHIKSGEGFSHVTKLAKLMKESDDQTIQGKRILVVRTVDQGQEKWDKTLHKLTQEVYPEKARAIDKKNPTQLIALLRDIQSDSTVKPTLPIEFHTNVKERELQKLFDRCTYSYLPAHRGATLRNSSILSAFTNQLVTYVHEGKATPEYLKTGGLHQNAVSMIRHDPEKNFYSYSAETVLRDIIQREQDPKLNTETTRATSKLINEQLPSMIATQHDEIYSYSIFLKDMKDYPFYYLPNERSLTIPRPEIACPLPKRYLGFDRLSRTLRHLASVVSRTMKTEFRCNPKEVQASMLVDKLHISSNFHSNRLAPSLLTVMTQDWETKKNNAAKWTARHEREHPQEKKNVAKWTARHEREHPHEKENVAKWTARHEREHHQEKENSTKWTARHEREHPHEKENAAKWTARHEREHPQERKNVAKWTTRHEREHPHEKENAAKWKARHERVHPQEKENAVKWTERHEREHPQEKENAAKWTARHEREHPQEKDNYAKWAGRHEHEHPQERKNVAKWTTRHEREHPQEKENAAKWTERHEREHPQEKDNAAKWPAKYERENRHLISLRQYSSDDHIFDATVDKGVEEITKGLGIPRHSNLSAEETAGQFVFQMRALRSVLRHCTRGDSSGVVVHAPPDTGIEAPFGGTATRHAERNIVQHLSDHAERIYKESLHCYTGMRMPFGETATRHADRNIVQHLSDHAKESLDCYTGIEAPIGETATPHAERNIVQHLSDHAKESLDCNTGIEAPFGETAERNIVQPLSESLDCFAGKHVLVALEGRFVPCGFCYEQEAVEQMAGGGGLFDPMRKRFLLHRSGVRAGKFFAREIQFFASSSFHPDPAEARARSLQMIEDIANSSPRLHTHGRPIVTTSFFTTDSEDSDEEITY